MLDMQSDNFRLLAAAVIFLLAAAALDWMLARTRNPLLRWTLQCSAILATAAWFGLWFFEWQWAWRPIAQLFDVRSATFVVPAAIVIVILVGLVLWVTGMYLYLIWCMMLDALGRRRSSRDA